MRYSLVQYGNIIKTANFDYAPPILAPNKGRWIPDNPPPVIEQYFYAQVSYPIPEDAAEIPYVVLDKNLNDLKQQKRSEINSLRDQEESAGFSYLGKTFDSDMNAIKRIAIAVQAAAVAPADFTIDWTTQDGSVVTLTKTDILTMPVVMAATANALHVKARLLKELVDIAQDAQDIQNIIW